jgi:rod shape determining protein RodA
MLFWAGVRPGLLLLLASPAVSLFLAAKYGAVGGWMVLLFVLLVVWRVYVSEGVLIYLVNSAMGVVALMVWNKLKPYQQKRITAFINPELDPGGASYQALQSKVAHGSGGLLGTGYTEGPQKRMGFLPEQQTDFIFPIVGEELGFVGICVALGLFLGFFMTLLRIARRATDPFGGLMVFRHPRSSVHPHVGEHRDDREPHADHRDSAAVLQLRRVVHDHRPGRPLA